MTLLRRRNGSLLTASDAELWLAKFREYHSFQLPRMTSGVRLACCFFARDIVKFD